MNHQPHCPVPVISYNGNLIVAAAQKYPKVAARLPASYLTETTTALGKLPTDVTGQKIARGETAILTLAQQADLDSLLHCMGQARKTAKLAFPGQTVKLHQEFQIGLHESHVLGAVLGRADIILASVQTTANLPAMKLRGWTDAETQTFTTVRGTFPASTTDQESGQSDAKKAIGLKDLDAADAYEHILTIQNAADLELPATDPANHRLLRLVGEPVEDWPSFVKDKSACFSVNLETTLRDELKPENFDKWLGECQTEFAIAKRKHAMKNPLVIASILKRAQISKQESKTLKAIVEKVAALKT